MPPLEINATQSCLIAPDGNVSEITHRPAVVNLALLAIETDFSPEHANWFRDDTATRVSANPRPQNHLAGLLRRERHLHADGSMSSNQSGDCNARSARREWATNSQGLRTVAGKKQQPHLARLRRRDVDALQKQPKANCLAR
jgi:hypothetical protein